MPPASQRQGTALLGPAILGLVTATSCLVAMRLFAASEQSTPGGSWTTSILLGSVVGILVAAAAWFLRGRERRSRARLARDLRALSRRDPDLDPRLRVPLPDDPGLQEIANDANELLEILATRIASLENRESRQRLIMESMASGVIVLGEDESIDAVNRAACGLFNIDEPPPPSTALAEIAWEPELHDLIELARSSRSVQRRVFRSSLATPESERELATAVAPIMPDGAENDVTGFVVLVDDATYLRQLERARTEFVGNVSHELRTPITALLGYIETIRDLDPSEAEHQQRFLSIAHRNAQRLARIIEDLLSLASLEDSQQRLDRDVIRLAPLLERIADRYRDGSSDRRPRIHVECVDDLELVGVTNLIEQAMDNLVSNAVRYGDPDGMITIRGDRNGTSTLLSVQDDGPGIAPRHVSRLFERFYRVDTARSRESGGTGLGLAIVKHIAAAHGGHVRVESQLGSGSRFLIEIPPNPRTGVVDAAPSRE